MSECKRETKKKHAVALLLPTLINPFNLARHAPTQRHKTQTAIRCLTFSPLSRASWAILRIVLTASTESKATKQKRCQAQGEKGRGKKHKVKRAGRKAQGVTGRKKHTPSLPASSSLTSSSLWSSAPISIFLSLSRNTSKWRVSRGTIPLLQGS